jgi:hypothetical protein
MVKHFRKRSGQASVEILIALVLFALGISALVALIFGGQSLTVDTGNSNRALGLARAQLEEAAATARDNFPGLVSVSSTDQGFTKQLIVQMLDSNTARVTSKVSWRTDPLRLQDISLTELLTNWKLAKDTGSDTGGTAISGDWKSPRTLGSVSLGAGNSATDLDVLNQIVYITAEASDPKKEDFFVVNATNGQAPVITSFVDTGPGLNAVDVAGTLAYAANDSTSAQLQIIDVSNPATSTVLAEFRLPGVNGSGATGESIFYANGKVYIGTKQANGPEFHIVDVSVPAAPVSLGGFEVNADINMIQISGHYAYLATSADTQELKILDVTNPVAIAQVGSFDGSGAADGYSAYLYGNTLYLGRAAQGDPDLYILDVSNPASVIAKGSKVIGADVNGVRVRDNLAFVGTSASNEEFQVWDITNPAAISLWSSFNFPQVATGIDYENNTVYVAVRSNDALRIITSTQ